MAYVLMDFARKLYQEGAGAGWNWAPAPGSGQSNENEEQKGGVDGTACLCPGAMPDPSFSSA
jgi:hypothetical protein